MKYQTRETVTVTTATKNGKDYTIGVIYDDDPISPLENDLLGKLHCWHRRINLGHKQINPDSFDLKAERKKGFVFPLYIYDHGGITLSLAPFSCPWDSGQVGWVTVPFVKAREVFVAKTNSEIQVDELREYITDELDDYTAYLNGTTYGYVLEDEDGDEIETCYGFYDVETAIRVAILSIN